MAKSETSVKSVPKKLLAVGSILLCVILIIASLFGKRGLIEIHKANVRKAALQQETAELASLRDKLLRDILELENNPKAVELKAREKLGYVRPDELVIIKR